MSRSSSYAGLVADARRIHRDVIGGLIALMRDEPYPTRDTWKQLKVEGELTRISLDEIRSNRPRTFWAPIVIHAERFAAELFQGARLLWASVSMGAHRHDQPITLGVDSSVVLFEQAPQPGFRFNRTLTRTYLDARASAATASETELGLCVTREPLPGKAPTSGPLHFIHLAKPGFRSRHASPEYAAALSSWNRKLRPGDRWSQYLRDYQKLVKATSRIETHISATSFFDSGVFSDTAETRTDQEHRSAAQVVVALDKKPSSIEAAIEYYQLLQELIAGITPVFAAVTQMRRQIQALQMEERRLGLVLRPLERLSQSLSDMQVETQELRAVLYEPARGLFHSHRQIADLFTEKTSVHLSATISVNVSHEAGDYSDEAASSMLATALLRVLGRAFAIKHARTHAELIGLAKVELSGFEERSRGPDTKSTTADASPLRLIRELRWLLGQHETKSLSGMLDQPDKAPARLQRIKSVLFDPYKIQTNVWPLLPLKLVARSFSADPEKVRLPDLEELQFATDQPLPSTYQHVLELFAGVAALRGGEPSGLAVEWSSASRRVALAFRGPVIDDVEGPRELASELYRYVLLSPREWRVEHQLAGNFRKPFVDFASRLLLGTRTARDWEPELPEPANGEFPIISLAHARSGWRFSVLLVAGKRGQLVIQWKHGPATLVQPVVNRRKPSNGNGSPEAWQRRVFLLDHARGTEEEAWPLALSAAGLIVTQNVLRAVAPREFLRTQGNDRRILVLLHGSAAMRSAWNKAAQRGTFRGTLVHLSAGAPASTLQWKGQHPRVHACTRGPRDVRAGQLGRFVRSVRVGVPEWSQLAAETATLRIGERAKPLSSPKEVRALLQSVYSSARGGSVRKTGRSLLDLTAALESYREGEAAIHAVLKPHKAAIELIAWLRRNQNVTRLDTRQLVELTRLLSSLPA